jgi:ribulose-bisphosphate carboxylase large chain
MARFSVDYSLNARDPADAKDKAFEICVEQSVEFPFDLVTDPFIRSEVVGQTESLRKLNSGRYIAHISFHDDTAGKQFTQLLNVIFGNTSIKPGIRVESIRPSAAILDLYKGPRFGAQGIRKITVVNRGPILASALKPLGLGARELASLAYRLALGGIDLIKDDHGLADQRFAPFRERAARCAEAVARANRQTGRTCAYVPNVTADSADVIARARFAKANGAAGVMISAMLTGFDAMRQVANDPRVDLPVIFHPALAGSFTASAQSGIAPGALYGRLARLAGADASIFPNYGGRFSFSREDCSSIAENCACRMGAVKKAFPMPGGGIGFQNVREIASLYGEDVILLIGGGLFRQGPDLAKSIRELRRLAACFS